MICCKFSFVSFTSEFLIESSLKTGGSSQSIWSSAKRRRFSQFHWKLFPTWNQMVVKFLPFFPSYFSRLLFRKFFFLTLISTFFSCHIEINKLRSFEVAVLSAWMNAISRRFHLVEPSRLLLPHEVGKLCQLFFTFASWKFNEKLFLWGDECLYLSWNYDGLDGIK